MALRTRRRNGRAVEINGVSSPADVTSKLLASLLNTHYDTSTSVEGDASAEGPIKVASMQWTALGRGVMSDVQMLDVSYESTCEASDIPNRFLAKFKKEEIPLRDLFTVEGQFYRGMFFEVPLARIFQDPAIHVRRNQYWRYLKSAGE